MRRTRYAPDQMFVVVLPLLRLALVILIVAIAARAGCLCSRRRRVKHRYLLLLALALIYSARRRGGGLRAVDREAVRPHILVVRRGEVEAGEEVLGAVEIGTLDGVGCGRRGAGHASRSVRSRWIERTGGTWGRGQEDGRRVRDGGGACEGVRGLEVGCARGGRLLGVAFIGVHVEVVDEEEDVGGEDERSEGSLELAVTV